VVKNAPVNYGIRVSGPVTALTARRVWHGMAFCQPGPSLSRNSLFHLHSSPHTRFLTASARNLSLPRPHSSLQPWHPSSWLMQPLRLVFSFDHLTSALFCLGLSTSLNAPSLADRRCRRFSAPDHTQTLLPLPLLPFQNPPALLRARNLPDLRIRTGSPLKSGAKPGARSGLGP
jgi:hypothetical protein